MKVLLAEDEALSRLLLRTFLEDWGYQVTVVQDGAAAWRAFQEGDFPIVLTDWIMPEMDGPDLIRRIRSVPAHRYVYIILLTAKSEKQDLVQGMEAGADEFMIKPPDADELRVRLRAGERIIRLEQTLAAQNQELRETQAALVQTEKLAGLGRLAAGVAHEINNPIASVSNNLAVLARDTLAALEVLDVYRRGRAVLERHEPALAAEAARLEQEADLAYFQENLGRTCEKSLQGLQRVRDIVRNLRDFARLDEADFKEADLNAALASALEILGHEIRNKEIRVSRSFEPLPPVLCHPGKINQVFFNLLVNAVQACSQGGAITARTHGEAGKGVVIEIEDNGCGIQPEHRARLFEPFFTTRPIGQGTGLGLSVSFGIIRDHGGAIEVESAPGRGSTFRVRLPLRPAPHPAKEKG
jgi:signal transduction histidine kinase